jgi:hypothetical protein
MRKERLLSLFCGAVIPFGAVCPVHADAPSLDEIAKTFPAPPDSAAPHTWWHWMNGNVTKEGVTADLEAMQRVGIRSATIVIMGGGPPGPIRYNTPEFFDMVKYAASEAKRLGMTIGIENCAGWSSSGGPWVTPANSMQTVVTSEMNVQGPKSFSQALPEPPKQKNYYQDIAVLAFPALEGDVPMAQLSPVITASVPDFRDPKIPGAYRLPLASKDNPQYLQFAFPKPLQARTLQIDMTPLESGRGRVEASDDGKTFRELRGFDIHFQSGLETTELSPDHAYRFYRIVFDSHTAPGNEITIRKVNLMAASRIDEFMAKCEGTERGFLNGHAFDVAPIPPPPPAGMTVQSSQVLDLTSYLDGAGKLTWSVPPGKWTILRIGHTTTGIGNHPAPPEGEGLECDKLSRAAALSFWNGMLAPLMKYLGPLTGTAFSHTLIDSYEVGNQNWTPDFAVEFQVRCGYDLTPYLPVFTGRVVDSPEISERVLWDIRRTIASLFAQNYYSYFAELAHEQGITLEAEPYSGPFDNIRSGRDVDRVMGEFWWPGSEMSTPKLAASIAHLYGKTVAGAESFTSDDSGWDMSPPTMKALGDHAFALGVNSFTFHRYTMQPWLNRWPGMTMGHNGSNLERTNTWWEQGKAWMRYLARCQYLLQQGLFAGDVLFFVGEGSPSQSITPSSAELPEGYDYDSCNTDVILHRLSVKDGKLVLPDGAAYSVLALPADVRKMTPALLQKLQELAGAGATILGPKPIESPSLSGRMESDAEVKQLAAELWDTGKITDKRVPEALADLKLPPDFLPAEPGVHLLHIHRRIGGNDLYFISNQGDTAKEFDGVFRVSGKSPELWHPDTGAIEKVAAYSESDGRTHIPMRLDPTGSVFVVFRDQAPPADHPASLARTDLSAAATDTLTINHAVYRSAGLHAVAGEGVDVTERVAGMVRNGAVHVEVNSMNLGGDPAPNKLKELDVEYTLNGQPGTKLVGEGGILDLAAPKPSFPDARLRLDRDGPVVIEAWHGGTYAVAMTSGSSKTLSVTAPDPMDVSGSWNVTFPPNWGAPPQATFDKLISWDQSPDKGIKYFSGTGTYTKTISIPSSLLGAGQHLYLDLGNVQVIAEVILNGKDLGILWKPPYATEITSAAHQGENSLEIRVTNLWPNRIIGDEQLPPDSQRSPDGYIQAWPQWLLDGKPSPTGRYTFTTLPHWKKSTPLFPSGLMGPVTLRPSVDVAVQ